MLKELFVIDINGKKVQEVTVVSSHRPGAQGILLGIFSIKWLADEMRWTSMLWRYLASTPLRIHSLEKVRNNCMGFFMD